jgi:transcriptional regulator with XRE-family HTH domain
MSVDRPSGDFGGTLRAARERRGVSLRQIANATKISVAILEGLERNDISKLPAGIFGRAFVRSYAIEVGLDPETTIQDFIAQFPADSVTAGHPASAQVEDHEAHESDRRMATTFVRLIAISVPIAAAVVYFGLAGRQGADPEVNPIAVDTGAVIRIASTGIVDGVAGVAAVNAGRATRIHAPGCAGRCGAGDGSRCVNDYAGSGRNG